ncbi:MAG: 2Fe-2S iron-sulfur cluster binding domain-containing protein [Proteobacteria bacterium]|nr:2Fe-2S iron-sulfur cluster binding domain-containing protein [Pseudomonadota bacterium]
MLQVTFVEPDGCRRSVTARDGATLMETAIEHDISGIVAFCGGMCACGTCHCYVPPDWAAQLPPADENEADTLRRVLERRDGSRLACQIKLHPGLDGLTVTVPARQRTP